MLNKMTYKVKRKIKKGLKKGVSWLAESYEIGRKEEKKIAKEEMKKGDLGDIWDLAKMD